MDAEFSSLMIFHWTHFLGRLNLLMGDSNLGEVMMSRAALLAEAQSYCAQLEIAMSF